MGNLPCPMPADFKHQHSHLIYAIRVGKTVEWIEEELGKCRKWHESKGILRTNWNTVLTNWLRKAVEFELQQEAGRRAYGQTRVLANGVGGSHSNGNQRLAGDSDRSSNVVSVKIVAAVNRWFDRPYKPGFVEHMIRVTMSPSSLRQALKSGGLLPEAERVVREVLGD